MFKVVLDANILISAILFGGPPRKCLELAIEGKIELFTSKEIIAELTGVLKREKFGIQEENLHYIVTALESITNLVTPKQRFNIVEKDPEDNKFIECAIEADADFIVSGDKHLLEISEFQKIKILKPTNFLKNYF